MRLQSEDQPSPSSGRRKDEHNFHSKNVVNNNQATGDEKEPLIELSCYSLDIIMDETALYN
jgi:hypothetical protein